MPKTSSTLAILALAGLAAATGASTSTLAATGFPAAPMRQAGTLTCVVDPVVDVLFGSTRAARCEFVSNRGGFSQSYAGRIDRAGIDIGVIGGRTLSWRVMTPGGMSRSGMLDGFFAGPSSEVPLLGSASTQIDFVVDNGRVVLQRTAYSGQAGFTFALGEARMIIGASAPAIVR